MRAPRILVVDDDVGVVDYLREALNTHGYEVSGSLSADDAIERLRREIYDVVLTDVEMPRTRGTELLAGVLSLRPGQAVVVMTAFGSIDLAVLTMRSGAADFVTKPFTIETLIAVIERVLLERSTPPSETLDLEKAESHGLIAESTVMQDVLKQVRRAARGSASVLLTGETGTGKSALARFMHEQSNRRTAPFLQVNCAALPLALVESELFGVRRGAFTDARENRPGMFLAASNGTLFLDEIAELPLSVQAKLLHALEASVVRPVGGVDDVPVQTRVIAATNRNVEELVKKEQLRADLYYRLNVLRIAVPPLRERRDDVPSLVLRAIERAAVRYERPTTKVAPEAMLRLTQYAWPGNVRELLNVVERAVALSDSDVIEVDALRFDGASTAVEQGAGKTTPLERIALEHVQRTLEQYRGNVTAAARALGINRRTLYRKLEKLAAGHRDEDE